jgi:hypothetical protein
MPAHNRFLEGSFAPVTEEITAFDLPVTGRLPAEQGFRWQVPDDFVVAPTRARQEEPDRPAGHLTCRTRHWCFVYRR